MQQAPLIAAQHSGSVVDVHVDPSINVEPGKEEHSCSVSVKQNPLKQHFPKAGFELAHVAGQVKLEELFPPAAQISPGKNVPLYCRHFSIDELMHFPLTQQAPSA